MAKVKIQNIVRFTKGTTDYPGITQASIDYDEGTFIADQNEGEAYPVGADNIGTPGNWPVTFSLTLEDIAAFVNLLTTPVEDIEIIGQAHGSNDNEKFAIANALLESGNLSIQRQQDGSIELSGFGYSADGSTHPFSRTSTTNTTAPSGSKTKVQNIASLSHPAITTPGVTGVTIDVNRGTFLPDQDEGLKYPTGADLVGTGQDYPVQPSLTLENMQDASLIGSSSGDLVVTGQAHGGNTNPVITAKNTRFRTGSSQLQRQQDGSVSVQGFSVADAGSPGTLPLTVA